MAFNNLGLQEPSTITARVGTVTIARGSTTEHQEIMVLGDVSSSNAIARVLSATPASTEFGLAVRVVEQPSTIVAVSTGSVRVHQSTAADLQATVAQASTVWQVQVGGYVAPSTTVNVSSLAGKVQVVNSSAADLHVTVAGYSTTANVSSVAGIVAVRPSDTNWASSAGFHFTSSGELQVNASFSGSTVVTISTIQGVVTVRPEASSNSSVYMSVRLSDGTSFIPISQDYTDGSTYSSLVAPGVAFNNSSNNTFRTVGLTTPFPVQMTDSSNVSVKPGDATNQAIRVNVVAGAAGGSTVMTVSTGSIGLAGVYDSSNALQKVGDSANQAIRVNVVAGAAGGSTIVTISTVQGVVTVRPEASSNSSIYMPIRLSNGTAFITPATDYQQGSTFTSTLVVGPAVLLRAGAAAPASTDTFVQPWASTFGAQYMIPVTDSGVSVMDSTNRAINVNVVAGAAGGSTIVTISTIQGIVSVRPSDTNWASSAGFHFNSSGELLTAGTASAASTTVTVSSLAGIVAVRPSDTNWASSAGFHFDSSGGLQVVGSFNASTTVNVSSVAGVVTVNPQASSNSSVYMSVRITDGTAFLNYSGDYQDGSTYSSLTAAALSFNNSSNNTFRVAGLTTPFPMQVTDSSNAGVKPGDSANNAIRVNVVAGAAGGSTIVTISTVQGIVSVRPSDTNWASSAGFHFDSSGALQVAGTFSASTTVNVSSLAGIVAVRPSDTNWASSAGFHFNSSGELQVVGTFAASTTVNVSSLAGKVQVVNSSAADLNVTVAGYSTTVNVSSVAGIVTVRPSDTNWASSAGFHFNSSGELLTAGAASAGSTIVTVSTGSVGLAGVYDSSNALQKVGDSVNSAIRVNVVAGAAGGSTIVTISTVIGVVTVRPEASSNSSIYMPIRLSNGTAFLTPALDYVAGSTFTSTSVQGPMFMMRAGDIGAASTDTIQMAWGSSAGALHVNLVDESDRDITGSTTTAGNSSKVGIVVRQAGVDSTFAAGISASSGDVALISSVAGRSIYVYSLCVGSGANASSGLNMRILFQGVASTGTTLWATAFRTGATAPGPGIAPANQSVSPPFYLFRTAAGDALRLNATSSGATYSVSAWRE